MPLFITGYHASGKSHLAKQFVEHQQYLHIETSAVVREAYALSGTHLSIGEWAQEMEIHHGEHFFDDLITDYTFNALSMANECTDVVITGNRSLDGIIYTSIRLSKNSTVGDTRNSSILFIETPIDVAYERFKKRNRYQGDDVISLQDYLRMTKDENDRGLKEIREVADIILVNDKSVDVLYRDASERLQEYDHLHDSRDHVLRDMRNV